MERSQPYPAPTKERDAVLKIEKGDELMNKDDDKPIQATAYPK
jgi:hypothetical protein